MDAPPVGLRQRRAPAAVPTLAARERRQRRRPPSPPGRSLAHIYFFVSAWLALFAIILSSGTSSDPTVVVKTDQDWSIESVAKAAAVAVSRESHLAAEVHHDDASAPQKTESTKQHHPLPSWLRWIHQHKEEAPAQVETARMRLWRLSCTLGGTWLDPSVLNPTASTPTDLIDKILTSTPRLFAIANLLLCMTYLLHTAVAEWFLGSTATSARNGSAATASAVSPDWAGRERLGGFLVFKLLLISAVVAPDTLDLLILLSWYTLLSFLRSLAHLAAVTTDHTTQSGQPPRPGVLRLLWVVLLSNLLAAAVCVALFHGAGWGMVLLLTCDCALLAVDVLCHMLKHMGQVLEEHYSNRISELEETQLQWHQRRNSSMQDDDDDGHNDDDNDDSPRALEQSRELDRRMEVLELARTRRLELVDRTVFGLQLFAYTLTILHFMHIWTLHGVQFTLIDGVLALHLHSALTSAGKKIAERRNLHRIARDLDGMFEDASEVDLRKASVSGDVCCICLGTMSTGSVKKVGCGHLYHTHCLREVVERARSMEAAKCPLCRALVVDGRHPADATVRRPPPNVEEQRPEEPPPQPVVPRNNADERALFRFSTENIFPTWLPLPAFSFEVVRRPPVEEVPGNNPNNNNEAVPPPPRPPEPPQQQQSLIRRLLLLAGAIPMSPEEEAAALEQLVDMFPQYERADLLRELRHRGSAEAVVESVLLGVFSGVARGER